MIAEQRPVVTYEAFGVGDVARLGELDRAESVGMLYAVRGGDIVSLGHGCEVSPWTPAQLNETVAFTRRHLEAGATGVAVYAGGRLAGVGILGHAPVSRRRT